jgi:hypothetical protein
VAAQIPHHDRDQRQQIQGAKQDIGEVHFLASSVAKAWEVYS